MSDSQVRRSQRNAQIKANSSKTIVDDSSESDSENSEVNYNESAEDQSELSTTEEEENENNLSESSSDSDDDFQKKDKSTWKSLITESNSKLILRRSQKPLQDSTIEEVPVVLGEQFNLESYLLAGNRMKYQTSRSDMAIPNDARKGRGRPPKRPRKGTRGIGGEKRCDLPERLPSNFSVTKEASRAATTLAGSDSGKHEEEMNDYLESLKTDFPRWLFLMRDGFSVILHGFGSKIPVFQAFKTFMEGNSMIITINGLFARKINPKKLLVDFCNNLKFVYDDDDDQEPITVTGTNIDSISEDVASQLRQREHRTVFFLVMNLDSLALNQPGLLTVLGNLKQVEWINVLASIDNIHGILGVNQTQVIQFNFFWITCSTFQPYRSEFVSLPDIFGEANNSKGGEHALQFVLKSLTGNAKKAFSILASLQLAKQKNTGRSKSKEFRGVEFNELARKCKESFIAHSETALRTLLVEFIDHKLISLQGKNNTVGNLLTVELDSETLEKFLNEGIF